MSIDFFFVGWRCKGLSVWIFLEERKENDKENGKEYIVFVFFFSLNNCFRVFMVRRIIVIVMFMKNY